MEHLSDKEIRMLLESITDEQAIDSDIGGDSDAEDELPVSVSEKGSSTRSDNSNISSSATSTPIPIASTSRLSRHPPQIRKRIFVSDSDSSDSDENIYNSDADPEYVCSSHKEPEFVPAAEVHSSSDSDGSSDGNQSDSDDSTIVWTKPNRQPTMFSTLNFNKKFGPNYVVPNKPMNYFKLFISSIFTTYIVEQSVLYASQKGVHFEFDVKSFNAFLGILIIMGINKLPGMRMYWNSNPYLRNNKITEAMPVKHFLKILRFLHLNNNENMPPRGSVNFDRVYKLRPMIDYLNKRFSICFEPSRYLSIDESMIAFKGRSTMKQYMPMKPIKRGFKVWAMACAVSGYLIAFEIYTGKDPSGDVKHGLGEQVILKFTRILEGLGYCVFFDNFFSSIPLIFELLKNKTFGCGTIRPNRKGYPTAQLVETKKMKKSDKDYVQSGDVSICKWLDRGKKAVSVISSMHRGSLEVDILRTNSKGDREQVKTFASIRDYNKYMGGVDRFDQLMSAYCIGWKSRRWWIKIFYYLIDCAIVNSYIYYKENAKQMKEKHIMSQLEYRLKLADELIDSYSSRQRVAFKKGKISSKGTTSIGLHKPVVGTYRRCANCSTAEKQKRSNLICKECNVALCKKCFTVYHEK